MYTSFFGSESDGGALSSLEFLALARDGTLSSTVKDPEVDVTLRSEGLGFAEVEAWGCWIFNRLFWMRRLSSDLHP